MICVAGAIVRQLGSESNDIAPPTGAFHSHVALFLCLHWPCSAGDVSLILLLTELAGGTVGQEKAHLLGRLAPDWIDYMSK